MKNKASLVLLALALLSLTAPLTGSAAEICPAASMASTAAAPVPPLFEPAPLLPEAQPKAISCTKDACLAARQECRNACLPCAFQFGGCFTPSCTGPCNCIC